MHTIKGTLGFLGLDPIVKLAHKAEDVLNALRRGECPLTRALMDAMLKARDQLGRMLSDLRNGSFGTYALEDLLHELASVLAPQEKQPERKSEPVRIVPVDDARPRWSMKPLRTNRLKPGR